MSITSTQYDMLKLMRGNTDSSANRVARLVLVNGISQPDAMREASVSRTTAHLKVRRYTEAYNLTLQHHKIGKSESSVNIDRHPFCL